MRRTASRDEQDSFEGEGVGGFARHRQMSSVDRVERPTEDSD